MTFKEIIRWRGLICYDYTKPYTCFIILKILLSANCTFSLQLKLIELNERIDTCNIIDVTTINGQYMHKSI